MVLSLIVWNLGYLGIPVNTDLGVFGVMGIIAALGMWRIYQKRQLIREQLREKWAWVVLEEILFLAGLVFMVLMRVHKSDIQDLEKFMDFGFMMSYFRSPTLPAPDMWFAPQAINYYSFGHFMGSIYSRLMVVDLVYSYNLLLGVIMGMGLSLSAGAVASHMGGKLVGIVGALVAAWLVMVAGNSHTVWYFLSHLSFDGYWYADATRFIYNTIHEFPSYSFVVSDLHGHVWALPVVLLFLGVWGVWTRHQQSRLGGQVGYLIVLGALLGVMAMTNTWDVMVYGLLMAYSGLIWLATERDKRQAFVTLLKAAAIVGIVMAVTAGWWATGFTSISQGVRLVELRSPLWQWLVLWGGHLLITAIAVIMTNFQFSIFKNKDRLVVFPLAITAVTLLILPELIYFKDIYPNHPRANTMFKLTYEAFIMMGVLGGITVNQLTAGSERRTIAGKLLRLIFGLVLVLVIGGLSLFPFLAFPNYYGEYKKAGDLDGLSWMMRQCPDDFEAIKWLKANVKERVVIAEAVGESYTHYGRVSVFTGLPTIQGWRVHEWLWRGGFDEPGKRTEEVKILYEKPASDEALAIREKYKVSLIFVGEQEREAYKLDDGELEALGRVVFRRNGTMVISVE